MSRGGKPRDKASTGKLNQRRPRARLEYRCERCGIGLGYHPHISILTTRFAAQPQTFAAYTCRNAAACDARVRALRKLDKLDKLDRKPRARKEQKERSA